jgi:protein-S-isoprenylcysteine O-methyltransferase Ste14
MSRSLNLKRVQLSGALAVGTVLGIIVLPVTWPEGTLTHKILWAVASVLIGLAALGRLYATAFLGGFKNQKLVTEGPFSVMRNPLYFFSFVGVCGIALATAQIIIILLVPPLFWVLIHRLMQREEGFLREKFGEAYQVYCAQTPLVVVSGTRDHAHVPPVFAQRPKRRRLVVYGVAAAGSVGFCFS